MRTKEGTLPQSILNGIRNLARGTGQDPDDLTQDAWLLSQSLKARYGNLYKEGLLMTSLKNKVLDRKRRDSRRVMVPLVEEEDQTFTIDLPWPGKGPEEEAEWKEVRDILSQAASKVGGPASRVLEGTLLGKTLREIALEEGLSISRVWKTLDKLISLSRSLLLEAAGQRLEVQP